MNTNVKNCSATFGWAGIVAAAAFCIMWLACFANYDSWSWNVNTVCDFGLTNGDAADIFNYGCALSGIFLAIYGIGRIHAKGKCGYTVAGILLVIAGICLALFGFFTEDVSNGDYHDFIEILLFIFIVAAVLAVAIQQYYDGMVIPVGITMILMMVGILSFVTMKHAEFENLTMVLVLIWLFFDGAVMIATGIKGGKQ